MSMILKEKIISLAAWTGNDFKHDQSWLYHFSPENIDDIDTALASLKGRNINFPRFSKSDFRIGELEDKLKLSADELENGRGFFVLRGLPIEKYNDDEINIIYYGIGLHLGTPVGQNPQGDLLGSVMNVGDVNDKNTRVYETNLHLPYHTDPSDVVGLLCVRMAKRGGLSSLVSVAAVYNEILEKHTEFLGLYYRRYYYAHLCENQPSLSPLFSFYHGKLSCRYLRQYIELGHEIEQQPLSQIEIEALDLFDSIMHRKDLRLDMMLEPGDLQFANNYAVLHSRTSFEDFAASNKRRKLLRLWLKMPNVRTLGPEFPGRNGFPVPDSVWA